MRSLGWKPQPLPDRGLVWGRAEYQAPLQMPCELACFTACLSACPGWKTWGLGGEVGSRLSGKAFKGTLDSGGPSAYHHPLISPPLLAQAAEGLGRGQRSLSALGLLKWTLRKLRGELAQGLGANGRWFGGCL